MKCPWCKRYELDQSNQCRCGFELILTEHGLKAIQRDRREAAGEAGLSGDEREEAMG